MNTTTHDINAVSAKPRFLAPTHFEHITLTTGHTGQQERGEVSPHIAEYLADKISAAICNGGWTDLKEANIDSKLQLSVSGTNLIATLWLPCKSPRPAVHFTVAAEGLCGADAWKSLCANANPGTLHVSTLAPSHPWIGVVLKQPNPLDAMEVIAYVEMMDWAGDFERSLAWGFVKWLESNMSGH
jgi:hypothetical protein